MGTAALEENMPQQPTAMREAVIYKILWNSRRRTTPWTGTGVLKFLQCAGVGTQGAPDFTDVLGPAYHGSQIRGILCPPLQGILWCEPRIPPVPQNIQRGSGFFHIPLVHGGIGDGGGREGTWRINTGLCGVFLCRQWTRCINSTGEVSEGILRPRIPL